MSKWKKPVPLCLALALFAIALPSGLVVAQGTLPVTVLDNSIDYSFGQQATFNLQVSTTVDVSAIHLYVSLQGTGRPEQHAATFAPGANIQAIVTRDLRQFPIPPFSQVTWWWELEDSTGNVWPIDQTSIRYEDNRFDWYQAGSNGIVIHATEYDTIYLHTALDVAQQSLQRIGSELNAPPSEGVEFYLYPSEDSIRAAIQMAGRDWMGGQARPELGVIVVAVPHDDGALTRMERSIPHEMAHYLIYLATGAAGYGNIPAWLDEGLATNSELRPDPAIQSNLQTAHADGRLIPLLELCEPFAAEPERAFLSYSQSASLVQYIIDQFGRSSIVDLLQTYSDGVNCEQGVQLALGISVAELEHRWRSSLGGGTGGGSTSAVGGDTLLSDYGHWIAIWAIGLLLALPMASRVRRRRTEE